MDQAVQELSHERELGRTELHFKKGLMGWLAKRFLAFDKRGDPYEETVILPALVSVGALIASEHGKLSGFAAIAIFTASGLLSGAWLGAAWGAARTFRVLLRGISVGLLISAGVWVLTIAEAGPGLSSDIGAIVAGTPLLLWLGHTAVGPFREVALVPEEAWQRAAPRRAWIGRVCGIAVGTEKPEGATKTQALAAHVLRKFGAAIGTFIGTAITAFIAGRVVFGMRLGDWLDLLKG